MRVRKLLLLCFLSLVIAPVSSEAVPVSVDCPGTVLNTTDREFTLTTDPDASTCLLSGPDANELNTNVHDLMVNAGWTAIDKDEVVSADNWFTVTGIGAMSGTFTIDPAVWSLWDDIAIGFVIGGGQIDPKWAAFMLPEGETSGSWSQSIMQGGGLSHGNLYGRGEPGPGITAVPEPATLLLLGSGLTIAMRRRRAKR
jgi:hypothetical protein